MNASRDRVDPKKLKKLRKAIKLDDQEQVAAILTSLRPPDQAELIDDLNPADQMTALDSLQPNNAADIFEELSDRETAAIAVRMPRHTMIRILNEMEPDEAVDVLDELPDADAAAIIQELKAEKYLRSLIKYPPGTAGSIMTTVPLTIGHRWTASQALEAIRIWPAGHDTLFHVFVTDSVNRLVGIASLLQLIQAPGHKPLREFMVTDVIQVAPDTPSEKCAELFQRYEQITLPVVNDENKIIGIITVDDLVDVIEKENDEDFHHLGATRPLERSYLKTRIVTMVRKRALWLLLLFGAAILTTSIMAFYEDQLESLAVLAVFIPLLIGTGGNSGAQTTTTIIRAMATGEIEFRDLIRVWLQEMRVGLLLGLTMAALALMLAVIMFGKTMLALTVSIAVFFIILTANCVGALLPLLAQRLSLDPTLLSAPLISTTVDAVGLIIYFSFARVILGV
jgi:magnesium transporter